MRPFRIERRAAARIKMYGLHPVPSIRIRPGHEAAVVNIAAGGVLVETERGLPPGASVELQMDINLRRSVMRGRVLRCAVAQLHASGIRYRSAIAFERRLAECIDPPGYSVPAASSAEDREARADATHVAF
jgi:PilZ domain-containing protein